MSYVKTFFRLLLGLFMTYAGFSHLTFNRQEFVAQVPTWLQFSEGFTDFVVLASGVVEIACCGRKRQLLVHCWHSFMSPSSLAISTSTSITLMPLVSTPTICVLSVCSFSQSLFSSLFGAQEAGSS